MIIWYAPWASLSNHTYHFEKLPSFVPVLHEDTMLVDLPGRGWLPTANLGAGPNWRRSHPTTVRGRGNRPRNRALEWLGLWNL